MKATPINKFTARAFAASTALLLLGANPTEAAAYMKLGDIKGEATDTDHKDWIIIESMSSPIFRAPVIDPATGVSRRRGDVVLEDITCTKELDKSSPKLAEAVCNGQHFAEVVIHFCYEIPNTDGTLGSRQQPYLTYKLKDVIVSSYSFHGNAAGDPLPSEQITLGYTAVEWTYISVDKQTGEISGQVQTSCRVAGGQS